MEGTDSHALGSWEKREKLTQHKENNDLADWKEKELWVRAYSKRGIGADAYTSRGKRGGGSTNQKRVI